MSPIARYVWQSRVRSQLIALEAQLSLPINLSSCDLDMQSFVTGHCSNATISLVLWGSGDSIPCTESILIPRNVMSIVGSMTLVQFIEKPSERKRNTRVFSAFLQSSNFFSATQKSSNRLTHAAIPLDLMHHPAYCLCQSVKDSRAFVCTER